MRWRAAGADMGRSALPPQLAVEGYMADDDKSLKDAERELTELEARAKALEKRLDEAEAKHPPEIDHADEGGVI